MVKKCILAREAKRERLIKEYKIERSALRKAQVDFNLSLKDRENAKFALNRLPRNSSPTRLTHRCTETGTGRSVYRKFKLNRITFRNKALIGLLPGVKKSSW